MKGVYITLLLGILGVFRLSQCTDDIGSICQTLWNVDANRLIYGVDFQLNLQSQLGYYNKNDRSSRKLFARLDERKLNKPTFVAFKALLDNYAMKTGITETLQPGERSENQKFLTAVMSTKVMKELHSYLQLRGKASTSVKTFKKTLYVMWFYFYQRKAYRDTSGFEHTFLGESTTKYGVTQISGFHNWLQFYLEEKKGFANYYGYYRVQKTNSPQLLKLQFSWHNYKKPVTSLFLGTSPEFELALYTACFTLRPNLSCSCLINGQKIALQTYTVRQSPRYVASAFPVV